MLPLFDEPPAPGGETTAPVMMSSSQRSTIRAQFEALGVRTAREQFDSVEELTGTRIASVSELDGATAQRVIERLESRVRNQGRVPTGNSWDDRTEDTWIDRL